VAVDCLPRKMLGKLSVNTSKEKLMSVVWNEQYSVKVKELDNQHKKLFEIINKLDNHMRQGKGKEILGSVLTDMVDYTKVHFAAEERILRDAGYPDYDRHKAIHEIVTEKVGTIRKKYLDGNGTHLSIEAMNYLNDWLAKHILGTDRKYSAHLMTKGWHSRAADAENVEAF
jgi:hemerythrin